MKNDMMNIMVAYSSHLLFTFVGFGLDNSVDAQWYTANRFAQLTHISVVRVPLEMVMIRMIIDNN